MIYTSRTLAIAYIRFRDTHLAHPRDATLTDPYEDPESNCRAPAHWAQMGAPMRCALGWNNMHPAEPWYRLPALYWADRARSLRRNGGYRYDNSAQGLRRHLLRAKDPIPHPHYPQK